MKNRLLVLGLVISGALNAMCGSAQAQIPVIRGGAPVFRAPQFRPDGPQPFSTPRSRELAASRSHGTIFQSSPTVRYSNNSNSIFILQPKQRVFNMRGRFFR